MRAGAGRGEAHTRDLLAPARLERVSGVGEGSNLTSEGGPGLGSYSRPTRAYSAGASKRSRGGVGHSRGVGGSIR